MSVCGCGILALRFKVYTNRTAVKARTSYVAETAVLQSCPTIMSRLIRKGDSSLLAAKVLVISRLLHKSLSSPPDAPPLVDNLRDRLAILRRKLLNHIDRQLTDASADLSSLVDNMCAYSLATSSTPTDVLRHFHDARLEAISKHFQKGQHNPQKHILLALKLYVKTLHDIQAIFPKRLADALARLKSHPLLQDKEVRGLVEMNLEIHETYVAENVRNFTPWPRHDELKKPEAEKLLKAWAKRALDSVITGLKKVLSTQGDMTLLVEVRKETLEMWLSSSHRAPGINASGILDDLRNAMTTRLSQILQTKAKGLESIVTEIDATLRKWDAGKPDVSYSLWDPATTSLELGNGAIEFRQAVVARTHGRTDSIDRILAIYEDWATSISTASTTIKSMRDTRWDDFDFEEDDSDSDLELGSLQTLLSQDDPLTLSTALGDGLASSFDTLRTKLQDLVSSLTSKETQHAAAKSIFVLRVLREVSRRLSTLSVPSGTNSTSQTPTISASILEPAYEHLAAAVTQPALRVYSRAQRKQKRLDHAVARELWDGSPALPLQVSPATFKFLRKLVREMSSLGPDLWGKTALDVAKGRLHQDVEKLLLKSVEELSQEEDETDEGDVANNTNEITPQSNGADKIKTQEENEEKDEEDEGDEEKESEDKKEGGSEEDDGQPSQPEKASEDATKSSEDATAAKPKIDKAAVRRDKLVQVCFDAAYVQRVLALSSGNDGPGSKPLEKVVRAAIEAADLKNAEVERLQRSAGEYWKRTYLLFALIVSGNSSARK
jgi:conserved oligomeric Golgi complex subunit 1